MDSATDGIVIPRLVLRWPVYINLCAKVPTGFPAFSYIAEQPATGSLTLFTRGAAGHKKALRTVCLFLFKAIAEAVIQAIITKLIG
jgi:hypothetical protein